MTEWISTTKTTAQRYADMARHNGDGHALLQAIDEIDMLKDQVAWFEKRTHWYQGELDKLRSPKTSYDQEVSPAHE